MILTDGRMIRDKVVAAGNRCGIKYLFGSRFLVAILAERVDRDVGINEGRHGRRDPRAAT